jgi:hypothetical protein
VRNKNFVSSGSVLGGGRETRSARMNREKKERGEKYYEKQ